MDSPPPIISFILCSRNDQYMGNSRWRLEICLNYLADRALELGRSDEVEVLVADWGSETPLSETLTLGPAAARIVSFVLVPPTVAGSLQGDSPFPEVLALNTAARRARGKYIGRIDQDTLVGGRFLTTFFKLIGEKRGLEVSPASALLYANRRSVPYRFSVRCPSLDNVERFVRLFGGRLPVWTRPKQPFWTYWVGIWLVHRDLWHECGGYDERLIFYNWMETDMILRLSRKYPIIDLGALVDYDFYHLEHQHPRNHATRHAKKNRPVDLTATPEFHPNNKDWGLLNVPLPIAKATSKSGGQASWTAAVPGLREIAFVGVLAATAANVTWDWIVPVVENFVRRWRHRAFVAWEAMRSESPWRWPRLLLSMWRSRQDRLFLHSRAPEVKRLGDSA